MVKSGDDTEHARRDFYRDPQLKPEDDIEGSSWGMTQNTQGGIFIEILSSSSRMT